MPRCWAAPSGARGASTLPPGATPALEIKNVRIGGVRVAHNDATGVGEDDDAYGWEQQADFPGKGADSALSNALQQSTTGV